MRYIVIIFLLTSTLSWAQSDRLDLPTVYIQNSVTGKNNLPIKVEGSPYLDEAFKLGTVTVSNDTSYKTYLRYNAFNDEIEMQDGEKVIALMKRDYITAQLNGFNYRVIKFMEDGKIRQGYGIPLYTGDTSFYSRYQVVLREGKAANSSYGKERPPSFEREVLYYIAREGKTAEPVRLTKKSIIEALSDQKASLDRYCKAEKLKLKIEAEVIQLLRHYDSL